MAKNRFAQPLYGKIIFIYETNLAFDQLSTVFDPSTYWIDVTGIDCEVGYIAEYLDGVGVRWVPPPPVTTDPTFDELKARKLEEINIWTEQKITGGFDSLSSGILVRYDSDIETQITMQGISINIDSEAFATEYPKGCPCRGYVYNESTDSNGETVKHLAGEKTIQYLQPTQFKAWWADLSRHIGTYKQFGWVLQSQVELCQSEEDLNNISFNEEDILRYIASTTETE